MRRIWPSLRRGLRFGGRAVPVVDHLACKYGVEDEAGHEAVQDQRVVDFLQSGEDARQGAGKVAEDLQRPILEADSSK